MIDARGQRRAFGRAPIGFRFAGASFRFVLTGFRFVPVDFRPALISFRFALIGFRFISFFALPRLSSADCQSSKNSSCRRDLSLARLGDGLRRYSPMYRRSPFCQRAYGRTTTTGAFPLSDIKDFGDRVRVAPCQKPLRLKSEQPLRKHIELVLPLTAVMREREALLYHYRRQSLFLLVLRNSQARRPRLTHVFVEVQRKWRHSNPRSARSD
jgi:hypothetical protein